MSSDGGGRCVLSPTLLCVVPGCRDSGPGSCGRGASLAASSHYDYALAKALGSISSRDARLPIGDRTSARAAAERHEHATRQRRARVALCRSLAL